MVLESSLWELFVSCALWATTLVRLHATVALFNIWDLRVDWVHVKVDLFPIN